MVQIIASGASDHTIRLWNTEIELPMLTLLGHQGKITSLSWNSEGTYLASSSMDRTARVWNLAELEPQGTNLLKSVVFRGHTKQVTSICWCPNRDYVVSVSIDKSMCIWNPHRVDSEQVVAFDALLFRHAHTYEIKAVGWNHDGSLLVSASDKLYFWTEQALSTKRRRGRKHMPTDPSTTWIPLGDWDLGHGWIESFSWNRDSTFLAVGFTKPIIGVYSVEQQSVVLQWKLDYQDGIIAVAWNNASTMLATVSNQQVKVWDLTTTSAPTLAMELAGQSASWYTHGSCLVTGSDHQSVNVWDPEAQWAVKMDMTGHTGWIFALAVLEWTNDQKTRFMDYCLTKNPKFQLAVQARKRTRKRRGERPSSSKFQMPKPRTRPRTLATAMATDPEPEKPPIRNGMGEVWNRHWGDVITEYKKKYPSVAGKSCRRSRRRR